MKASKVYIMYKVMQELLTDKYIKRIKRRYKRALKDKKYRDELLGYNN